MRRSERHRAFPAAALLLALVLATPAGAQAPAAKPAASAKGAPATKASATATAPAATATATATASAASAAPSAAPGPAAPNVQDLVKKFGEAAKAGDWPRAYEAMQAAFAMQKTYDILGNLGSAELELGKHRAAAEHLAWSLHEFPAIGKPEAKKVTAELLARATANVATLRLKISPPHARVRVGDRVFGPADYREMVFVEPGDVVISAGDAAGYAPLQKQLHAEKGKSEEVELSLKPEGNGASSASPSASAAPSATPMTSGPNKAVLGTGIGVTAAGIGVGIGLLVAAAGKKGEADKLRQSLLEKDVFRICESDRSDPDCQRFFDAGYAGQTFGNVGASLLIGSGIVGAATVIYYVVTRRKPVAPPVKASVFIAPGDSAFTIEGKF